MITITFDFDGTLTKKEVQKYFKELMKEGYDLWVLTARYDELHKHNYPANPTNEDLYHITDRLNLPRHKVIFMNMRPKWEYLKGTTVHRSDYLRSVGRYITKDY